MTSDLAFRLLRERVDALEQRVAEVQRVIDLMSLESDRVTEALAAITARMSTVSDDVDAVDPLVDETAATNARLLALGDRVAALEQSHAEPPEGT